MVLSNSAMDAAAGQVRAIAASMSASIGVLESANVWAGEDAERFARDWDQLVTSRLHVAANKLDGISFTELVVGFDGQG